MRISRRLGILARSRQISQRNPRICMLQTQVRRGKRTNYMHIYTHVYSKHLSACAYVYDYIHQPCEYSVQMHVQPPRCGIQESPGRFTARRKEAKYWHGDVVLPSMYMPSEYNIAANPTVALLNSTGYRGYLLTMEQFWATVYSVCMPLAEGVRCRRSLVRTKSRDQLTVRRDYNGKLPRRAQFPPHPFSVLHTSFHLFLSAYDKGASRRFTDYYSAMLALMSRNLDQLHRQCFV